MPDPDDLQLLLDTHRGREAAARLLWTRHAPRLHAHARSILRSPAAAEDVVQTVMCRILSLPRERLAAITDATAFLVSATRREALNYLRAARRESARRHHPRPSPADPAGPLPDLHTALDALPRRQREVLVLKHAGGLTFDQIALALATNRNTVAGRYRAALESLKKVLAAWEPSAAPAPSHSAPARQPPPNGSSAFRVPTSAFRNPPRGVSHD